MAANSYYNTGYSNNPPTYEQANPHTDSFHRQSPAPTYTGPSGHPYADSEPPHIRDSQHSLGSDQGAYVAGGRLNEGDHYAENIPLKENTQYSNGPPPANWMQQPTHYPPDPAMLESAPNRSRGKKKGFFKKKTPFVTYILTVVQIAVFIAELVKSGMSDLKRRITRTSWTNWPCRTTHRIPDSDETSVQSDDRTLGVHPDQHGSAVRTMYEECRQGTELSGGLPHALPEFNHKCFGVHLI